MSVIIKNFGNDTECFNVSELKNALRNKYQNMSVSIVDKKSSGIKNLNLVEVKDDGLLICTHSKKIIDLSSFNF
jgi:hypothetical protein